MKISVYLFILFLFTNCGDSITEVIIESYSEGKPKIIHFISKEGEDILIHKKISLKENGDTLSIYLGDSLKIEMTYYESDTLKTVSKYLYNKKSGEWKYYHDNGAIDCQLNFTKGVIDSTYQEFYSNGKKAIKGSYINGIKDGQWKYFDSDGELIGDYKYLKGDVYYSSGEYIKLGYGD
jgi:antitoxin component YwqK of YwqJK toxin-antitoxin module